MLDKDRGTYSPPTEDNLSYETRRTQPRDQVPLTLIISGIVLVVVLLAAVLFFNSGMSNRTRIPAEVGDALGEFKDEKVQDARILTDEDLNESGETRFTPGSETPLRESAASVEANVAPPVAAPIEGPLPSQAASSSSVAVVKPAETKPVVSTAPAQGATGTTSVQIGAYNSQDQANSEYAKVASSYGLFLGGAGKKIERVETDRGTFYRTAFTGLSADKARSFCAALKDAGRDCIVR